MIYQTLGQTSLSRLGMGNMRLPVQDDRRGAPIDYARAQEIIDYAIASGINYFDTAYTYHNGESEPFLGEALSRYPRDGYHLATKFFILADADYRAVFERQLARLKTDRIDFYLIHAVFDHTCRQYFDSGCIEYFLGQKRAGRIRHLGFSSHASVETLETFADHHAWDFAQIQLNCFDWRYGTAKLEYEALDKRGIPVMAMEPVRGGRLAALSPAAEKPLRDAHPDWSVASWALRWVKRLPAVRVILSGMSAMEQIRDNVSTFADERALTDAEEALLMEACEIFRREVSVPCTACRYCVDGCPTKISIPEFLAVYNRYKTDGVWALDDLDDIESDGKPADCIACGACAEHCPQNIDIQGLMRELAVLREKKA